MKKLLLSLGALSAVVAPVAAVVACGSTSDSSAKTLSDAKAKAVAYANEQKANAPEGQGTREIDDVITKINASKTIDELRKVIIGVAGGTDVDEILGLDTPVSPTISNAGLSDSLAQAKAIDAATVKTAGYGDVTEKSIIDEIDKATTMDQLTIIMADVTSFINSQKQSASKVTSFSATDLSSANKLLAQFGVSIDQGAFRTLVSEGLFSSGNTLKLAHAGVMADEGHGSDDFALLIENEATTETTGYNLISSSHPFDFNGDKTNSYYKLNGHDGDVVTKADYYDEAEDVMQGVVTSKWGGDFAKAIKASSKVSKLAWIQIKGTTATIEVQTVVVSGDKRLITDSEIQDVNATVLRA